jgi:hypothetical protein
VASVQILEFQKKMHCANVLAFKELLTLEELTFEELAFEELIFEALV